MKIDLLTQVLNYRARKDEYTAQEQKIIRKEILKNIQKKIDTLVVAVSDVNNL